MSQETPYHYDEVNVSRPELSAKPIDKRPLIIGALVALVIVLIFGAIGWWLFVHPTAAAVLRDVFIIFMGLGIFIIILLLIALVVITAYLVLKVNDLVQLLEREIKPLLVQVQGTVNKVRGTTNFISEQAVKPVITTVSTVAAIRAIFQALFQR